MFSPALLPRNLEASFRDIGSQRWATRVSSVKDLVLHARRSDATRARAIPQIERLLREDPSSAVRAAAATALADLEANEALPTLLFAMEDDDPHVRQMAISALGEIRDARACVRLERALSDPRPEVRYQAIIAYARVATDSSATWATRLCARCRMRTHRFDTLRCASRRRGSPTRVSMRVRRGESAHLQPRGPGRLLRPSVTCASSNEHAS